MIIEIQDMFKLNMQDARQVHVTCQLLGIDVGDILL